MSSKNLPALLGDSWGGSVPALSCPRLLPALRSCRLEGITPRGYPQAPHSPPTGVEKPAPVPTISFPNLFTTNYRDLGNSPQNKFLDFFLKSKGAGYERGPWGIFLMAERTSVWLLIFCIFFFSHWLYSE